MEKDIFTLMGEKEPSFSKGQKGIAQYIQDNPETAAFMTAAKISKAVGVSESTVVRFALELGYSGYPELQAALRQQVLKKLSPGAEEQSDGIAAAFSRDLELLTKARDKLDREQLVAAAEAVARAGRVFLHGSGRAAPLCRLLEAALLRLHPGVRLLYALGEKELCLALLDGGDGDVFVELGLPGDAGTLDLARRMGLVTLLFGAGVPEQEGSYVFSPIPTDKPGGLLPMGLVGILQAFLGALEDIRGSVMESRECRAKELLNREVFPDDL